MSLKNLDRSGEETMKVVGAQEGRDNMKKM